jgi:hypothetical protein
MRTYTVLLKDIVWEWMVQAGHPIPPKAPNVRFLEVKVRASNKAEFEKIVMIAVKKVSKKHNHRVYTVLSPEVY